MRFGPRRVPSCHGHDKTNLHFQTFAMPGISTQNLREGERRKRKHHHHLLMHPNNTGKVSKTTRSVLPLISFGGESFLRRTSAALKEQAAQTKESDAAAHKNNSRKDSNAAGARRETRPTDQAKEMSKLMNAKLEENEGPGITNFQININYSWR